YLRLDSNSQIVDGSINIEYIKLEEASIATPYQPNLFESPYYLTKDEGTGLTTEYTFVGIGLEDFQDPNKYIWNMTIEYINKQLQELNEKSLNFTFEKIGEV
ncbi:TPA: hypothetical protein ACF3WW_002863, partial [Enterococcus hirae]